MQQLRVLSHYGDADAIGLPGDLQHHVEIIEVPTQGPLPAGTSGDVLLARRRAANLYDAAEGVQWVHIVGTGVDGVVIAPSLEALLPSADTVVLACPLTDETRHLLDGPAFALMTGGVHLVNVARGELIDDDALHHALDDGRVARASLDATFPEP